MNCWNTHCLFTLLLEDWKADFVHQLFVTLAADSSEVISMSFHRSAQNNCKGQGNICHHGETKAQTLLSHPCPTALWQHSVISINTLQENLTHNNNPQTKEQNKSLTFCKDINRRSIGQEPRPALELPGGSLDKHGHHTVPGTHRGRDMGMAWNTPVPAVPNRPVP